jgi:hypothetical protein
MGAGCTFDLMTQPWNMENYAVFQKKHSLWRLRQPSHFSGLLFAGSAPLAGWASWLALASNGRLQRTADLSHCPQFNFGTTRNR